MTGCCTSGAPSVLQKEKETSTESELALQAVSGELRHDWKREEIAAIYHAPLLELVFKAACIHRMNHDPRAIQQSTLLSIKTGGCSEDCSYCPQSAKYDTGVKSEKLLDPQTVFESAKLAKEAGSTRFCMGAAWREMKGKEQFDQVISIVEKVATLDMEICVTLGMLTLEQAQRLKQAGVTAYNHNLDTGEKFYSNIISTRTYQDRLETLKNVRAAGMIVCCGGIVGMGESDDDRIDLLHTLASMEVHPESVPVNALVAVEGTPLAERPPVQISEMLRMIATARLIMPKSLVRLSAGRTEMSLAEQALCFMAGANSIFAGEKLLTTANPEFEADKQMFASLGLRAQTLEHEPCC